MTDNTQELDEILDKFGWTCVADGGDGYGLQNEDVSEAKQAILDWHNKQVEELLDRLEAQWGETIDNTLGKPIRIKFVSVSAIQAERAKLEEVK